jgi:hypothetical protein
MIADVLPAGMKQGHLTQRLSMSTRHTPPEPVHVEGMKKGEELVINEGHEPGRGGRASYRSARDSTSINPKHHKSIGPAMPDLPPS